MGEKMSPSVELKICGMKYNTAEVAALLPDYLGFIFFNGSPRNYDSQTIPSLPPKIKKVGVFVNASGSEILEKIKKFDLDVIQLHGEETKEYIQELRQLATTEAIDNLDIWKVFSVKDHFDFSVLKTYEEVVDAFLFDTKGKGKGGNGYTFDWSVLKEYPSKMPIILSGGIGLTEVGALHKILNTALPIIAIDINSKLEDRPGLKNIENVKTFKEKLYKQS